MVGPCALVADGERHAVASRLQCGRARVSRSTSFEEVRGNSCQAQASGRGFGHRCRGSAAMAEGGVSSSEVKTQGQ